ncbi:unnamed protein product [Alternaria alternata]
MATAPSLAAPSAQASHTLRDAFERFALSVSQDDQLLFHNTELKDVRDEALQIEKQLRKSRIQKNIARLDPLLRGMEHYSKVVEVLCNGTPYLSWIWAPIKLMLMITVDSLSAFEKLIDAYGKIGDMLPRLDRLSNALIGDQNFQKVLALVFSDIVEFHRRAYKFVRRKSWTIFFGSMWAGFETRFNGILKDLAYHSELVDKEASAADITEAFRRSKVDDEKWEQQEREWNSVSIYWYEYCMNTKTDFSLWIQAKVHKVLGWLETNDTMPADILDRHLQDYLPDSCDWFVQHKETQLWLKDVMKNPLLWLCGKPGAGKSVICSALVRHAEDKSFHVFYYFCSSLRSNADGPICRPSRLLRSIISQLIQKHQDLAIYVHDVYFLAHPVPTKKALMILLPELLRGLGSVRLIVDGIDEWASRDQKDVLHDLSQIVSVDQSSHTCKILVASRETIEISRSLRRKNKPVTTISLSNGDEDIAISRSIANFVESKLSDLPDHFDELDPDASIMACVKKTLIEKSHGMFLWVSLVLDLLDRVYSPEELRTIVDDLPSDLEELYEKLFARLSSAPGAHSHGGVARVMGLVCSARRPLHKSELLQALSILPHDTGSRVQNIPVASILDHCKPLIEELLDSTIVPVHFSVKEYFLKSHKPQIVPAIDATLDISSACVVVITRSLDLLCVDSGSVTNFARITETNVRNGDERLELFSGMPIFGLMADILQLRRSTSQKNDDRNVDIEAYIIERDRTLFSRLSQAYENAIVYLLEQREVDGITTSTLLAFQESYASIAFRCRFPQCDRLSLGFATAESRLKHEAVHIQRVYCQTESCQYNRIGFANKGALNVHTRKHHSQSNTLLIPAKVRGTRDRSSASDVNADLTVKPQTKAGPPSYWTVTELQDLHKNIPYFGTDFEAIARYMGTKTGIMIQNEYSRLVQNGWLNLEESAKEADARRERGEDLGPPPTPTPAPKRRYESAQALSAENLRTLQETTTDQPVDNDRPLFAIGADSGNGAAHYFEGARPVTNLVLPEKKRAKLAGSETSTPGAPRMLKAQLPSSSNIDVDPNDIDLAFEFGDDAGALENFDFDSFLHTRYNNDSFGNLVSDFDFPRDAEV